MGFDTAFTEFPVLTTSRLTLRQLRPTDAEEVFAFRSKEEVMGRYGQEPHQSLEETKAWIQRHQGFYARHEALLWCVTMQEKDIVIGTCLLWAFDGALQCAELGYELHPAYGQQGIMTEAASAVLNYAFNSLGLHRVEAIIHGSNGPSRKMAARLGFTQEGILRERHYFRGHFEDELYFGLLKEEWLNHTNADQSSDK
jgi:[ribosomal protein S5]-alanine N-acetyltransferase